MAKQTEPFKTPITLGYMVWCDYQDGETPPEPEGIVYFDSPPSIGDVATLSDGKTYKVKSLPNEQMEVTVIPV